MKLVTFGCSWMYGDELKELTPSYRNSHNLGGVIYQRHNDIFSNYLNYAGNGASNERIVLQLLEYINSENYSKDDFLIVSLTSPLRRLDYINNLKIPLTIPHWHEMHLNSMNSDTGFIEWFKLDTIYNLNSRNEIKRYVFNLLSIKNLIKGNKHLVFQSIDNPSKVFDGVELESWFDVPVHFYSKDKDEEDVIPSVTLFDRKKLKKELTKNLSENQNWLDFEFTWQDYLKSLDNYIQYFPNDMCLHPNEYGVKTWYNNIVKEYIEKL
jgi:hypothetical protein